MANEPLPANSLAEAYLYLMATPCDSCRKGPLKGSNAHPVGDTRDLHLSMTVTCNHCKTASELTFHLVHGTGRQGEDAPPEVNQTDEHSRIIDVAQWITLFRAITEAASKQPDKQEARRLGIEAAQCLEEALKFYDEPGNDLPPPEALFHDSSRERFRANPEQFSRKRLLDLRNKLPSISFMRSRTIAGAKRQSRKPWWRFGL